MSKHSYQGGCHCHTIRFEFILPQSVEDIEVISCNCSLCEKTGYLHLIIPKDDFNLQADWGNLSNYQFNKKIAQHYFCKNCGIKSFYQPRSHPDCWSVNLRCLNDFSILNLTVKKFEGRNWEKNISSIT